MFIGRLGPAALAAMGVTFPLSLSFVAIATGTAIGATSLIARSRGGGDREIADRTACVAIPLCFLLSGLIAVICLPNLDAILRMLGTRDQILPLARSYMSILIVFNIMGNLIRAGEQAVRLYSLAYFTLGIRMVPGYSFQGIGKGFPATVLTATQTVGLLLPAVLMMPRLFGVTGLWLAFPLVDALGLLLGQRWMNRELRRQGIKVFPWKAQLAIRAVERA